MRGEDTVVCTPRALEEEKHQPTFHPVALKVFPAQPTVMVLSHIPGRVATHGKIMLVMNTCHPIYPVNSHNIWVM